MADSLDIHIAERQRLISMIESSLHFLVRAEMTREEAIDLKQKISRPLGVLNVRHGLDRAKRVARDTNRLT